MNFTVFYRIKELYNVLSRNEAVFGLVMAFLLLILFSVTLIANHWAKKHNFPMNTKRR